MESQPYQARRATVDDLEGLRRLWRVEQLPALKLEKRFTEFQVVQAPDGQLIGALALEISGLQGRLHSEVFSDFGLVDTLRPLLWERLQSVARNRGLVRLWTLEGTPFWRERGFDAPAAELMEKLPPVFGDRTAAWLALKLKDELLSGLTADQEFALFKDAARESTEKAMRQARVLKRIATVVAILFFIVTVLALMSLMRVASAHRSGFKSPPSQEQRR